MQNHPKIAILGYGIEGRSIERYLRKNPKFKQSMIVIRDRNLSKNYLSHLELFDVIFRSPGIPYLTKEIQSAKKAGVKIFSATKLFFEQCPCPIIGVTGSKGKGTTATLIYKILKLAKKDAYLLGNIGAPALDALPKLNPKSIAVLELSSFQLQDLTQSPKIAVVLGISKEHLDHHKNFREYLTAKSAIAKFQESEDLMIFNQDNRRSQWIARLSPAKKIGFSLRQPNDLIKKIRSLIKIPGEHNILNAYAAALTAQSLKIPEKIILNTVKGFRGLSYRLQKIHSHPDIYNDSASTNPEAAIAAIKATHPTILIMGGQNKNLSYTRLRLGIKKSLIKKIYLYGVNQKELRAVLKNVRPMKLFPSLKKLFRDLKKHLAPENIVLFSPGATSLDQFQNYQERGDLFNKLSKQLY